MALVWEREFALTKVGLDVGQNRRLEFHAIGEELGESNRDPCGVGSHTVRSQLYGRYDGARGMVWYGDNGFLMHGPAKGDLMWDKTEDCHFMPSGGFAPRCGRQ